MKNLTDYINNYNKYQEIFVIIKPGFQNYSAEVLDLLSERLNLNIKKMKVKKLLLSEAKQLYNIHKNEEWFEPLCKYMSSDISTAYILYREDNPSDIFKDVAKLKDEIREKYGESDMRNVMHSSDSKEHMLEEMKIYF